MKTKNIRVLKNGVNAGYVYYPKDKKWKWRFIKKGGNNTTNMLLNDNVKILTYNMFSSKLYGGTMWYSILNLETMKPKESFRKYFDRSYTEQGIRELEKILENISERHRPYCLLLLKFIDKNYREISKYLDKNRQTYNRLKKESNNFSINYLKKLRENSENYLKIGENIEAKFRTTNKKLNSEMNNLIKLNLTIALTIHTQFRLITNNYERILKLLVKNTKLVLMLQEVDSIFYKMILDIVQMFGGSAKFQTIKTGNRISDFSPTCGIIVKGLKCQENNLSFTYKSFRGDKVEKLPALLLEDYNIIVCSIHVSAYSIVTLKKKMLNGQINKNVVSYIKGILNLIKQSPYTIICGGDFNTLLHLLSPYFNYNQKLKLKMEEIFDFTGYQTVFPREPTGLPLMISNMNQTYGTYPGIDGFLTNDEKTPLKAVIVHDNYKLINKFKTNGNSKNGVLNKINGINNFNNYLLKNNTNNYTGSDHRIVELKLGIRNNNNNNNNLTID
jgi:hypothetical protein